MKSCISMPLRTVPIHLCTTATHARVPRERSLQDQPSRQAVRQAAMSPCTLMQVVHRGGAAEQSRRLHQRTTAPSACMATFSGLAGRQPRAPRTSVQVVHEGQLLKMDAGCERHGYVSDVTRTWPVSGRFSAPQQAVYETVLAVHRCVTSLHARRATPAAGLPWVALRWSEHMRGAHTACLLLRPECRLAWASQRSCGARKDQQVS